MRLFCARRTRPPWGDIGGGCAFTLYTADERDALAAAVRRPPGGSPRGIAWKVPWWAGALTVSEQEPEGDGTVDCGVCERGVYERAGLFCCHQPPPFSH